MTSLGDITDREGDIGNIVIRGGDSPYYPPIHGGYPSPPRILPPYMTF